MSHLKMKNVYSLYDRTLPGGLQRLGRRRDLYDVGDAS